MGERSGDSNDRFTQAEEAMRLPAERKIEIPEFLALRYYFAFLKGDQAGMDREVALAAGQRAEDCMSHHQALVLARSGRMGQARIMWERAIASALQAGNCESAAIYEAAAVRFEYLPTLRALSALAHSAPWDAIERLQPAVPYDFALPGTAFFARFGGLYPAYVRGEAYLQQDVVSWPRTARRGAMNISGSDPPMSFHDTFGASSRLGYTMHSHGQFTCRSWKGISYDQPLRHIHKQTHWH